MAGLPCASGSRVRTIHGLFTGGLNVRPPLCRLPLSMEPAEEAVIGSRRGLEYTGHSKV